VGDFVNIERCLTLHTLLSGHLVYGHVDGLAQVVSRQIQRDCEDWTLRLPRDLLRFIAVKGSIAIHGISLTVTQIVDDCVWVSVIPHTLQVTVLQYLQAEQWVNIEVDMLARYVARLIEVK